MFEREKEFVAPKAKTAGETGLVAGAAVLIVAIVAILITKVSLLGGLSAILIVIPFYLNTRTKKEYSYSFMSDRLSVSISDYKGKKTMIGEPVFLENLIVCAKDTDGAHNAALNDQYDEVIDARTSPSSKTAAFAAFERDGKKTLVRFEPVDMMAEEMKKYAKDKVFI